MNSSIPTEIDWLFFVLFSFITIMFLYQAWENLIRKRISRYSLDAFVVWFGVTLGSKKTQRRVLETIKRPNRLLLSGIYALSLGFAGIYLIVFWLKKFFIH